MMISIFHDHDTIFTKYCDIDTISIFF